MQVRVTREGSSYDLHPSSEDWSLQDPVAWRCGKIWHGDSTGGRHGGQPQSAR